MCKWIITRNALEGEMMQHKNFEGGYQLDKEGQDGLPYRFRLLDDDGEIYFLGWSNDSDSEEAFEPLDNFGAAYGCTDIQYYFKGGWESL